MDRQIVYPAQIPLDSDQLNAQRNAYVGLGQLAAMAYGWATVAASGFACTPGTGLAVTIAPGSLLAPGVVDGAAYGTLAAVASALVRQYGSRDPLTLTVPGAGAAYTVYATPATVDADDTVLPFYNAADPSVTYAGADNSGNTAPTVRQDVAQIGIGTSVPAGAYPLWTITVPAGATALTADMIVQADGAPFYDTIPQLQAGKQDALGFLPVQNGGGISQTGNKIYLGIPSDLTGIRLTYNDNAGAQVDGGFLVQSKTDTAPGEGDNFIAEIRQNTTDWGGRMGYRIAGQTNFTVVALQSDVTYEATQRIAGDAAVQSNLTTALSTQATENSTLAAGIASSVQQHQDASTNGILTFGYDTTTNTLLVQDSTESWYNAVTSVPGSGAVGRMVYASGRVTYNLSGGTTWPALANFDDVTTVQSNLTSALSAQAAENSTLAAGIASSVQQHQDTSTNGVTTLGIDTANLTPLFHDTAGNWLYGVVSGAGTGRVAGIAIDTDGNLILTPASGTALTFNQVQQGVYEDGTQWRKQGDYLEMWFSLTLTQTQYSPVYTFPEAFLSAPTATVTAQDSEVAQGHVSYCGPAANYPTTTEIQGSGLGGGPNTTPAPCGTGTVMSFYVRGKYK